MQRSVSDQQQLRPYLSLFPRYSQFYVQKTHLITTPFIQPQIWKCFPCTQIL